MTRGKCELGRVRANFSVVDNASTELAFLAKRLSSALHCAHMLKMRSLGRVLLLIFLVYATSSIFLTCIVTLKLPLLSSEDLEHLDE